MSQYPVEMEKTRSERSPSGVGGGGVQPCTFIQNSVGNGLRAVPPGAEVMGQRAGWNGTETVPYGVFHFNRILRNYIFTNTSKKEKEY